MSTKNVKKASVKDILMNATDVKLNLYDYEDMATFVFEDSKNIERFDDADEFRLRVNLTHHYFGTKQLLIIFRDNFTKAFYKFDYYPEELNKEYEIEFSLDIPNRVIGLYLDDQFEEVTVYIS